MAETLILGSAGMLARAVRQRLQARGQPFSAPPESELDIVRPQDLARHIDAPVRWVINCAAWTDVDGAETEEHAATRLNGTAVELVAARCAEVGATLVHYSTDYVFDGAGTAPYPVDAPRNPVNAYGRSKLAGELSLERSACRYYLVRTSWLYAPWGKNFVLTMQRLVKEREQLRVVHDQVGRPTNALWLAEATLRLLQAAEPGAYHVTDGGQCSWFELTRYIATQLGSSCTIEPCTSADFPRPAPRPAYSVLDLSKTEQAIGQAPHYTENVKAALEQAQA
jgi:dTDP-4-dehydrorhamnose reductase